jgi:hypothetical protein
VFKGQLRLLADKLGKIRCIMQLKCRVKSERDVRLTLWAANQTFPAVILVRAGAKDNGLKTP